MNAAEIEPLAYPALLNLDLSQLLQLVSGLAAVYDTFGDHQVVAGNKNVAGRSGSDKLYGNNAEYDVFNDLGGNQKHNVVVMEFRVIAHDEEAKQQCQEQRVEHEQ